MTCYDNTIPILRRPPRHKRGKGGQPVEAQIVLRFKRLAACRHGHGAFQCPACRVLRFYGHDKPAESLMTDRQFIGLYTALYLVALAAALWASNALTMARFDRIELNPAPVVSQAWEQLV